MKLKAPNDTAYKRRICHSGYKCCANYVETSRPQQWVPDLPYFFGQTGHADPLAGVVPQFFLGRQQHDVE